MAIAASSGIKVDVSQSPPQSTPKNLVTLRFNDPRVGLRSAPQIELWRRNLTQLLPHLAPAILGLPVTPATLIGDTVGQVTKLMVGAEQTTAPTIMAEGPLQQARRRVADRFGRTFASKSSDRLLTRLVAPARESFGAATLATAGVVLEFTPQSPTRILAQRESSRTQRLASRRDAFYRLATPMRAAIEKSAGVPVVQLCWLNSTMRVVGQVGAIASVAEHQALQVLDVPRTLRREMNVSGLTVHAAAGRVASGLRGGGVRVAVIDGEVNVGHPAFGGRATLQENFTSEAFGQPDPHGTAVAGIIAADDPQFSGIAPEAQVLNYKVFPTGSDLGGEFEGLLAVEHALRDGADVVNCSWGMGAAGDGTDRAAVAFNTAWAEGLVIVKSAGNDGPGANTMTSPADAAGVIVVGATEREGTAVQGYSSRGPTANGRHPHLVAPGGTSVFNMITCLAGDAGGFGNASFGTSLAAPVIAGAATLLREKFPTASPDDIRSSLLGLCKGIDTDLNASGAGLLDLAGI